MSTTWCRSRARARSSSGCSSVPLHPGDLVGVTGYSDSAVFDQPRSPGLEGMGVVEALGQGVTGLETGRRVAFFPVPGTLREYITAPARFVVPVPDEITDTTAALLLVNTLTMRDLFRAIEEAWAGSPRPTLQTAAGSSVARLVTAAAVHHGYLVVNLVRSERGAAVLRDRFPSVPVVSTSDPGWTEQALMALGGRPRVVLDAVGGAFATQLIGLLENGGTFIAYGLLSGEPLLSSTTAVIGRELRIRSVSVGQWAHGRTPELQASDVEFAVKLARKAPELFEVAATYDLTDFQEALAGVGRPGKVGTVLLTTPVTRVKANA
jgi:NADPH:quinone reductase-like Zn-dependent oxidoreductase